MGFNVTVTPIVQEVDISASVQAYEVEVVVNSDVIKYAEEAKQSAEEAEASALQASASASDALASENAAQADAVATAADRVQTGLDRTATGQDRVATGQDRVATGADRLQTGLDRTATGADRVQTGIDANTATTQAGIATTQANTATAQAVIATNQAGIATTQAGNALTSANTATTQAGIATTQAGIATTQAGIATTQAGNASTSANAAAASASAAAQVGTGTLLTGFSVGANTAIAGTDSILQAFNKTQGQINARVSGSGVAGQVAYWSGTNTQAGSANLVWDNTNGRLTILGNATSGIILGDSSAVDSPKIRIITSSNHYIFDNVAGSLRFVTETALNTGGVVRMRLSNNGNLGVGQNTPADNGERLQVYGNGFFTGNVILNNGNNASPNVSFRSPTNRFNIDSATGVLRFFTENVDGTGGVVRAVINPTGNVGINTTTDAGFRLDVNGTARVQGSVTLTAGANIILATTTGTRIGTATNQLLSFWNKTPIAQPTTGIAAATLAGSGGATITAGNTFGGYTLQQIAQALINIGILT